MITTNSCAHLSKHKLETISNGRKERKHVCASYHSADTSSFRLYRPRSHSHTYTHTHITSNECKTFVCDNKLLRRQDNRVVILMQSYTLKTSERKSEKRRRSFANRKIVLVEVIIDSIENGAHTPSPHTHTHTHPAHACSMVHSQWT